LEIRRATARDAKPISTLIKGLAHFFTLHPQGQGADVFLQSIEPAAIEGYISAPNFSYFVGYGEHRLAGVVAIRDNTHLYHLFVAQEYQGRGWSRQLWEHAKEVALSEGNHQGFTVNSTPHAVPVYERFGFKATGPRVEANGIAFVPMQLMLEAPDGD
jgi:GNAT superfamily N-acetyltransferase